MKKFAIALACIALAFGAISCKKSSTDPDQIDLTKYNPQDEFSCWKITWSISGTTTEEYVWTNEYGAAASVKSALEIGKIAGRAQSGSWESVSAADEEACNAKNKD